MSYDPYNDPDNPVNKGGRPDLGKGNGGGDFTYGSGGRDIKINPAEDGTNGGYTEAQRLYANWNKESGNDNDADDSVSPPEDD